MMHAIGSVIAAPFKLLGLIPSAKSTPALPAPVPTPTRDMATDIVANGDAMARRRGGAADIVTGRGGMEAPASATGKARLGS